MVTTVVVVAVAFIVGMAANRLLRRRLLGDEAEALTVRDLAEPLQTLAVLVLAFVLVMAADSYGKAEEAARVEAGAVEHLFEVSAFAPPGQRQGLQADAVCYARAVVSGEWPSMKGGHHSEAPDAWSDDFRRKFGKMTEDSQFSMLVDADKERSDARRDRLSQSTPAIPDAIYWFMLVTLVVTVIALAFCLPYRRGGTEITALLVVTALLTASLLVIRDVDRPFGGLITVKPVAMQVTDEDATKEFAAAYGGGKLPCDAGGRAV